MRRAALCLATAALLITAAEKPGLVEWPWYAGDPTGNHYSPLATIHRGNVNQLALAWEWKSGEVPMVAKGIRPGPFEATPLMIDGVAYLTTPYNKVVALDAETGRQLWVYDPQAWDEEGQATNPVGYVHRGVTAWRDGGKLRLFATTHFKLTQLDASTGKPVLQFGDNGAVDLSQGLIWEINKRDVTNTSPPMVYRDLVIVSNSVDDRVIHKNDPPGDIRAYNARTGKRVWTFHTIPQAGEPGNETWQNDSWKFIGHANVWSWITMDEKRGLLYFPVGTPSNDFYGGQRPGANLYGESLVCLNANTGKLVWHYQLVHHGLWDYDLPAPPNLVTLNINGRKVDAAVQLTKMGYIFVFDRVTGKPLFPIEERPVPASDVPGEQAWPTQPAPLRPPPIAPQGVTLNDAFDLTPELKAEAQAELKKYKLGPLFTPPSLQGTVMRPGVIGGANWGGGMADPSTGILYVKTSSAAALAKVARPVDSHNQRSGEISADYAQDFAAPLYFHNGLPLLKPPYGLLTAVDLNKGEILWQRPFGDNAAIRNHPALQGVQLPPQLGAAGAQGGVLTRGGLIFLGGGDNLLHAVDQATGKDLWTFPLGRRSTGTPATWQTKSGRQIVVIATGQGADTALMAFALPQ